MKKEKETPPPPKKNKKKHKKNTINNPKTKTHQKLPVTNKLKKPSLKEYCFAKSPNSKLKILQKWVILAISRDYKHNTNSIERHKYMHFKILSSNK